jgi:protein gp37
MAENSAIEWTEATWNPIAGCKVVSPGCTNCYAMRDAGTRLANHPKYRGLTVDSKAGPVWTGEVRLWPPALDLPRLWRRPRMIFADSMSDLFDEAVREEWLDRIFDIIKAVPRHTYQLLTKRSERMQDYISRKVGVLPQLWLGVSVEDRARLARCDHLRATPAALRFLSLEPLLGDIGPLDLSSIDWVIVGGESGPGDAVRPMHPDWARRIREQCLAAGVPFFFKQWGEWRPAPEHLNFADAAAYAAAMGGRKFEHHSSGHTLVRVGKKIAGDRLDDEQWHQYPLRRRAAN